MREVVRGILKQECDGEPAYLLMNSKRDFGQYTGFFYPLGGGVEVNETHEDALRREFLEEVNIHILPSGLIAVTEADFPGQEVNWWECEYVGGVLQIKDPHILSVGYFTRLQMEKMKIWPATRAFFDKYIFR